MLVAISHPLLMSNRGFKALHASFLDPENKRISVVWDHYEILPLASFYFYDPAIFQFQGLIFATPFNPAAGVASNLTAELVKKSADFLMV